MDLARKEGEQSELSQTFWQQPEFSWEKLLSSFLPALSIPSMVRKFDSLIYKGAAVTAGARGTYHSRVVRRTVVRFCPQKCIEQNIAYCRFHLKILSLQHAEILGHVICCEKSLDALFREQQSEAWMEAIKHSI